MDGSRKMGRLVSESQVGATDQIGRHASHSTYWGPSLRAHHLYQRRRQSDSAKQHITPTQHSYSPPHDLSCSATVCPSTMIIPPPKSSLLGSLPSPLLPQRLVAPADAEHASHSFHIIRCRASHVFVQPLLPSDAVACFWPSTVSGAVSR